MKKSIIILPAMFILGAIAFVSCNKKGSHTCVCTYTVNGETRTQNTPLTDVTKSEAESACEELSSTIAVLGENGKCSLK